MGCRDRISSLPDEILGKILSFVPTELAASTSVLSKRWRNLLGLGLVDTLWFDESMVVYPNKEEAISGSDRFLDFVVNTLLSNSPINIKKFALFHRGRIGRDNYYSRVYPWIWTAMERGLLELHLECIRNQVNLERDLLTSNTLVKLTLSCKYCLIDVESFYFPALKSLSLLSVGGLDFDNYCRFINGCPVLEELFVIDADKTDHDPYVPCCTTFVESASIKRLVVSVDLPYDDSSKEYYDVTSFKAPSLVYLDYSSVLFEDYQFVDLDSLVQVKLNLRLWESTNDYDYDDDDEPKKIFGDVTKLVAGISNITMLHLSPDSLEAFHFCCKSMPVFNNILNLSIESNKEKGWQGLVHRVTNKCGDACTCICIPKKNKKRKILKEVVSCLWTCQVKVLEISEYGGSIQELKQMRHFLGKLKCLETVKVGVDADNNNCKFLQANLLALPILSSKCNNIQFI